MGIMFSIFLSTVGKCLCTLYVQYESKKVFCKRVNKILKISQLFCTDLYLYSWRKSTKVLTHNFFKIVCACSTVSKTIRRRKVCDWSRSSPVMIGAGTYPTWPAPVSRTSGAGAAQQGGGSATLNLTCICYTILYCVWHHIIPALLLVRFASNKIYLKKHIFMETAELYVEITGIILR